MKTFKLFSASLIVFAFVGLAPVVFAQNPLTGTSGNGDNPLTGTSGSQNVENTNEQQTDTGVRLANPLKNDAKTIPALLNVIIENLIIPIGGVVVVLIFL